MARQRISPQSGIKLFESYTDFSGGLNTETSNERLRENEFPILDNVDLAGRGSAKRRWGRTLLQTIAGTPQGMSYFYRPNEETPDVVIMSSGLLYVYKNDGSTPFQLPIEDGYGATLTFQTTKQVEAVQYNKTLYIATGTKICELSYSYDPAWTASTAYKIGQRVLSGTKLYECTVAGTSNSTAPTHTSGTAVNGTVTWRYVTTVLDGWYAKVIEAYKPSQMEFIYVGTNAIATDPSSYVDVADTLGVTLGVQGIVPSISTNGVNKEVLFTAYPIYTTAMPLNQIEYKWEYKKADNAVTTWTLAVDFGGHTVNKSYTIKFAEATTYNVRVTVRHGSATATYELTNYVVTETPTIVQPFLGIQSSTKVTLHWDRLIFSGDSQNPYQIYISELSNPYYYPTTNTISFDTGKQEAITAIIKYRDYLVLFTKTTVHSLTGKSPDDYSRALIHDGIGCVAGRTAHVTGNNILFLSAEGIYQLRPNQYVLETLNVFRADNQIKSTVYPDTDACGMVFDSQYFICFPSRGYMYRLYYEQGVWVRDISSQIKFTQMAHYGFRVIELSNNGKLYLQNNRIYEKIADWQENMLYGSSYQVINRLNNCVYECVVGGMSNSSYPTHTSGTVVYGDVSWKFIAMLYADGTTVYDMGIQSKYLDLSMSFNYKKLKKIYILAKHFTTDVALKVKVEADAAITLTPDTSHTEIISNNTTWVVQTTPNFHFYSGTTVGTWALGQDPLGAVELSVQRASVGGKCRRARVTFTHSENVPCEIYGFGLEFKEKKT